jgi:chemotaxis protein CheC
MSESIHVLVVRAAGLSWALPMGSVEQTFAVGEHRLHDVAGSRVVVFRGDALELVALADRLGAGGAADPSAGVVVWAGGRRRVFGVDGLVGQLVLERQDVPAAARGAHTSGVVLAADGEVIPVLEPGVIAGAWSPAGPGSFGFSDLQRSALLEIANIGSGNAATALSQLLGKPVEIGYADALLATLAEAADKIGAAAAPSAVVDTPVADEGGKVLLLFPDGAAEQLCELFGTRLDDEMGRSALREVGNILASSYLNAVVEMTGLDLAPQPPTIEVDLLGSLVARSLEASRSDDPTVLMRSVMTVESSDASFAFLFVPQFGAVEGLLERLGVGGREADAA